MQPLGDRIHLTESQENKATFIEAAQIEKKVLNLSKKIIQNKFSLKDVESLRKYVVKNDIGNVENILSHTMDQAQVSAILHNLEMAQYIKNWKKTGGPLPEEAAFKLLKNEPPGTYLVRFSHRHKSQVITVKFPNDEFKNYPTGKIKEQPKLMQDISKNLTEAGLIGKPLIELA